MSFGVRQIWVHIPVLTPKTPVASVQLLASLHFGFRIYKMEGKEHPLTGRQEADRKVTVESAWQRQIQWLLRNATISRGQTNSHTLPVCCKLTPRAWGLFLFLSLVKQHPHSSLEDDPSLPILWGALTPTQPVIVNLGKGWGHSSEGSGRVACFGILPVHFRGFSPTCCKRRGWTVGISLSAEDICFEGSKDPGGTVLKAKKWRAITLPLISQAARTEQCELRPGKNILITFLAIRNEQNTN